MEVTSSKVHISGLKALRAAAPELVLIHDAGIMRPPAIWWPLDFRKGSQARFRFLALMRSAAEVCSDGRYQG